MPDTLPSDLITYEEAATILGGNAQKVRHMVVDKRLTPYKLPGYKHKFLSRAEVEQAKHGRRAYRAPASQPGVQHDQGGVVQASTLTADDKAILSVIGDKFVALAATVTSALAPYLGNSYVAFFQYKTAEVQGGPLGEYMHQTKQTMLEAARQATQTGITEELIADTLEKVANSAAKATGPLTPDDLLFQKELQEMLKKHVQRSGALTTDAAPVSAVA